MRDRANRVLRRLWLGLKLCGAELMPNAQAYDAIIREECEREYSERYRQR